MKGFVSSGACSTISRGPPQIASLSISWYMPITPPRLERGVESAIQLSAAVNMMADAAPWKKRNTDQPTASNASAIARMPAA